MSKLIGCISKDCAVNIRKQCELLDLAPSSYYHKGKGESQENLQIMRLMDEEFLEHPTHGVSKMQGFLRASGLVVNHKRVHRLLTPIMFGQSTSPLSPWRKALCILQP